MKEGEKRQSSVVPMTEIELDKKRMLNFDLNALAMAEKAMSDFWGARVTMGNVLSEGTVGSADLRAMLWAGLVHEEPGLTLEQVGAMIRIDNMLYAQGKLMDSLTAQGIIVKKKDGGAAGGGSTSPVPPTK